MDRIIKTRREKQSLFSELEQVLSVQRRAVYIYGPPGIGKTWTLERILQPRIELDAEILKAKQSTLDFLEKARSSACPILIDDFDSVQDLVGVRELTGSEWIVIVANAPPSLNFEPVVFKFPPKPRDELVALARTFGVPEHLVDQCGGDIRFLEQGVSDRKDEFWTPKDFVRSLICKGGDREARNHLGEHVQEHGHVMDMMFDNYIDGDPSRQLEVLECLSLASLVDEKIYEGHWDLLPYFGIEGCMYPASLLDHSVPGPDIRPGSIWTKFSNMCMRRKKVQAMSKRVPGRHLDVDSFMVLRNYFEKGIGEEFIRDYKLEGADFDVLNHLCLVRKLKARTVSSLKKKCQEMTKPPKKSTSTSG
jgi:hypothetical protein